MNTDTTEQPPTATCPSWCVGGHGPRFAHTSTPSNTFDVITQLRMHQGKPTALIVLDAPRNVGVTLELYAVDALIARLTNCRNWLAAAIEEAS